MRTQFKLFMLLSSLAVASCSGSQDAEVDFPSNSELLEAFSLSEVKAEETSEICDAKNVMLTLTYPSGAQIIYDYGTIKAGEKEEPSAEVIGEITFDDVDAGFSRKEDFDTGDCTQSGVLGLGTPLL